MLMNARVRGCGWIGCWKGVICAMVLTLIAALTVGETHADQFSIDQQSDRLVISCGGKPIASFVFQHEQVKRPFFAHVKTLEGTQVTRHFPPQEGDPDDHQWMHPGIWMAFAVLNQQSFWHNRDGRVIQEQLTNIKQGASASWECVDRFENGKGDIVCRAKTRYQVQRNSAGWTLVIRAQYSSTQPLVFGVKEEMGLGVRVATPISVKHGNGSIRSSKGGKNEKGTWGQAAKWWDYAGTIDGKRVGLMVMSGPDNPVVWSHSRDYGLLVANPFAVDVAENRGKQHVVQPGKTLDLTFGIAVHQTETFDPNRAYRRFVETLRR